MAALVVIVPYLVHFAYTRLTTMPPGGPDDPYLRAGLTRPPSDVDRTEDLLAALEALPEPLPLPVPTGDQWVPCGRVAERAFRHRRGSASTTGIPAPSHLLTGPWDPSRRFLQGEMVEYLRRTDVRQALETVAAVSRQQFRLPPVDSPQRSRMPAKLMLAVRLLVGRARTAMAEHGDFDVAARDIQTALRLATRREEDRSIPGILTGAHIRQIALKEVAHWPREFELSSYPARRFSRWLQANPYDFRKVWRCAVAGLRVREGQVAIDERFTKDRGGNGWYVLRLEDENVRRNKVLRVLNLLSPFFNDRRTVTRRIHWQLDRLAELPDMSYAEAKQFLNAARSGWGAFGKPTEAGMRDVITNDGSMYHMIVGAQAHHRVVVAMMALSAFRSDHGYYPGVLEELAPDYLETIPVDPFSGRPMGYRAKPQPPPLIYSVGYDGRDDGGRSRTDRHGSASGSHTTDLVLGESRGRPDREWALIDAATSRESDGRPGSQ